MVCWVWIRNKSNFLFRILPDMSDERSDHLYDDYPGNITYIVIYFLKVKARISATKFQILIEQFRDKGDICLIKSFE